MIPGARVVKRVPVQVVNTLDAGREMAKYRKEAGRTQVEIADLMGISPKELQRIETGRNEKISFVTVCAWCLCFDIPLQEVATWFGIKGLRAFTRKVE